MIAVASSFPSRAHAAPFGSGTLPPPSTRRSTSLRHPRVSALGGGLEGEPGKILDPRATPFQILGLDAAAGYSAAELKAAFRARVKEFHPDVCKDPENADLIMRRVIEAYQVTLCTILVFCTSAYGCYHNNHNQTSPNNYNSQCECGLKGFRIVKEL
ncbi:Chaperone DnaJ-domain superfamily protein [Zea mays]|uniref:Chaperone DnaJ-domain superfamily protein n=1 Tax=Zea mays TaxID=4577 RepID=A0A1D6M3K5_MAIZE|nr:Chaperone DnaJ-domain superfamily protein [Zea mays]